MDILVDWNYWGNYDRSLRSRPAYLQRMKEMFHSGAALIILGIRRSGKSSLAELLIKDLLNNEEIESKDILTINFEDPRFPSMIDSDDLLTIYETYLTNLNPSDHIVILDEVQNVKNWERSARYILESRGQKVIITGSSSRVLDHEVSDLLTGRHVDIEVTPLSFSEVLDFNGIKHRGLDLIKNRIEIKRYLSLFLKWGGFPEVVLSDSETMRKQLLKAYFEDILIKDVVKRYNISDIGKLETLAHLYVSGITDIQSFNKLKDRISSSLDTVERYSGYMQNARLFFFIEKFDWSRWKQLRSRKKVYVSDMGFYSLKGFRFSENRGKVMENVVAIELIRRREDETELYYWRDYQDHEVDFVVKKGDSISRLIQVSAVNDIQDLRSREIRSLLTASRRSGCIDLFIVTEELELDKEYDGKMIRFVPLWKWLLDRI